VQDKEKNKENAITEQKTFRVRDLDGENLHGGARRTTKDLERE